jgi:hypothetical protein
VRRWFGALLPFSMAAVLVGAGLVATGAHAAGPPTFVQQATGHRLNVRTLAVTTPASTVAGNRLIVEVGVWNWGGPTITSVTDDAGDTFVRLLGFTASDKTQMSVWTAVVATGGTRPTITATASGPGDIGIAAVEYSGLSTVAGTSVLDREAHASGTTGASATTVSSGSTAVITTDGQLAMGFYADSGFGTTPTAGAGYTARASIAMASDMDMLVEDRPATVGQAQVATAGTAARTTWLMAVLVLKAAGPPPTTTPPPTPPPTTAPPTTTPPAPTAPGAPMGVSATPGNASAGVSWTAPSNGGSPITAYSVTPYIGTVAQASVSVSGSPPATSMTVGGLSNGTTYTFTVRATNAVGSGPASAPSAPVTPGAGAQWGPLQTWPIVALSSTLLHNGSVIAWDGWQQPQPTVVWNPSTPNSFTTMNAPSSVFCDGAATLPDGRLLVVGGYGVPTTGNLGLADTNIFDPATNTWTRVADMHHPRWYPTVTELADGRYVAISGNDTNGNHWADTPEVYDPATNTWTLLTGVSTPQVHETEYPISYLVPSGKVFTIGPEEDNSFLLDVNARTWVQTGGASGVRNGSSVMYRPGRVLYSGGGVNVNAPGPSARTAAVIDLTAATPDWQTVASMNSARVYHTLTMMADGKVLAVGGSPDTDQRIITSGVLTTEVWDPATGIWTTGPSMAAARNYHSTALLMPDGRVLVAGGGHPFGSGDNGQFSAQYYSPAYLFNGPRPVVTAAPSGATYGSTFTVNTPDPASIRAVNLVSLGAGTHQVDMNQHFVPLSFTADGSGLRIQAPAQAELAPPGYYMLFIVDDRGVPSVASMVQMRAAATAPAAPTGVTAVPGDGRATVSWTAPNNGGSPILSYAVTPVVGGVPQPPTTVTGNPPATSATVTGLANGAAYTFTVRATNAVGSSSPSAPSGSVVPSPTPAGPVFVQQASAQGGGAATRSVRLPAGVGPGRRLIVSVGVWSYANAVTTAVTDSAGDSFVEIGRTTAADGTELSLWTAPVTNGVGQMLDVTAQASGVADIGIQVLDYAGLSAAADLAGAVDRQRFAAGLTSGAAATVSSGPTAAATAGNELAVGFYADSGFGRALTGGTGWTVRANLSPNGNMDLLSEDRIVAAGETPNATVGTGPNTYWEMATVIFKTSAPPPTAPPGAPTNISAVPRDGGATVTWTAPATGGGGITSYRVTPYAGAVALPPVTIAGSPPATSTNVGGLTNGTAYTFVVSATNGVGTGPDSAPSAPVTPAPAPPIAFVQQASARRVGFTTVSVSPPAATVAGNRLIVEVAVWNWSGPTVVSVTDDAGDTFTRLTSFVASDKTQISVWTAPVATGGTRPNITATVTQNANIGIVALEYAGLSGAAGTTVVDRQSQATGTTTAAGVVSSGPTAPVTVPGALAIGFYADSGFGNALVGGAGWTVRANHSPNNQMDMLVQDTLVGTSATPAAGTGTGANTVWLASTIVFKPA